MHRGDAFARPPSAAPAQRAAKADLHPDDVGPMLAQAALMADQQPQDDVARALLAEAGSRALTGQASFDPR
jgi:hypothetical protein